MSALAGSTRVCRAWWLAGLIGLWLAACARGPVPAGGSTARGEPVRFLALGDSYTIGEGVAEAERWPVQLAARLRQHGIAVEEPVIVAQTGWTTGELIGALERQAPAGTFGLVSLLAGVNNQYRGLDREEYRREFRDLLHTAIQRAGGDPGRVLVLSIPDWGVTPFAEGRDREQIAREIDGFNAVNRQETEAVGARYVDVTPVSRSAAGDPSLVAPDGLHPSGKMYGQWVDLAVPAGLAAVAGSGP